MAKETEKTVNDAQSFEYKETAKEQKPKKEKKQKQDEKYDNLYNQFIRLQADFDNYKKRNASIASSMYTDGFNDAMMAILPTIDSLDNAINTQSEESIKKGLELIKKAFLGMLNKYEIEEIETLGKDFDPNCHEAVMNKDDPENAGKVVQVFRAGYKRGDKVLRHTMCVVGQ